LGLLDYLIPEPLLASVLPGVPVRVPLGKRQTFGYVAALTCEPPPTGVTLKAITALDGDRPPLPPSLIELLLFAADYYAVLPGEMLGAALPVNARAGLKRFRLVTPAPTDHDPTPADAEVLAVAARFPKGFSAVAVEKAVGLPRRVADGRLKRLVQKGFIEEHRERGLAREVVSVRRTALPAEGVLSAKRKTAARLLERIPTEGTVLASSLVEFARDAYKHLKTLEELGLIERVAQTQRLAPYVMPTVLETPPMPNDDQVKVLATLSRALERQRFMTYLLYGVTGSGKTEIYLRLIAEALAQGRTALVLVPEIALTPQLGARFRARFGNKVATFHSGLTPAERRDEWERVASGEAVIGLGARSALFLPLTNVGVVIVDEEHESSFKQDETPRYHARDLAVVRGMREQAVVVLGSATPSLESSANATQGRYQRLELPRRVANRPLPTVEVIDLARSERLGEGVFTRPLAEALDRTLKSGEQAVLFLNRRGFAPYIYCRDCGHTFRCPDCDVTLTLHLKRGVLLCHYCAFQEPAPDVCGKCLSHKLAGSGLGTEKVEDELLALFGPVTTVRLDRDVIHNRRDLERALERFYRREAQVLIGTQMVTKGHDFPGVTLVGVVAADASLNFPDFRAAERTFQLLSQVAGRAGRGDIPGKVLIQTYEVEHYAIRAAAAHDFDTFLSHELNSRRELNYPPFSHLALVRLESRDEARALTAAEEVVERLRRTNAELRLGAQILGPAPAPLSRLKGVWRMQILIKAPKRSALRPLFTVAVQRTPAQARLILDVDPLSML